MEGHDFPNEINGVKIQNGMKYTEFARVTLNRIGNLRLITKYENDSKKNNTVYLDDGSLISSFKDISDRCDLFSNYFFNCPDLE